MRTPLAEHLLRLLALSAAWTSSTDPGSTCEEGWVPFGSSCYKKMTIANGWLGARYDCVWEGGDLVSIASLDEEDFVKKQMGDDDRFWIGLSNLNCDEAWCRYDKAQNKLTWSDARVTVSYSNWDWRQVGSSNIESCAYVNQGVHRDSQPGKWRHSSCRSSLPYMCERSPYDCPDGWPCAFKDFGYDRVESSSCDPGDMLYDDSCYHFGGKMEFWNARKFCEGRNSHMASVHSAEKGKFLGAHMRRGHDHGWLGIFMKNKQFYYTDGTSTADVPWVGGKVPTWGGSGGGLNPDGSVETFMALNNFVTICQSAKVREAVTALPPSTLRPDRSKKLDVWVDNPFNDFSYLLNHKSRKTWQEARDDCVGRGGDLLSITSSYEQKFIQGHQLTGASLWLGVNANITEGRKWTDGSSFTYKNLKAGIAGEGPGGSCLSLLTADGRWEFADCKKESSYICKRRVDQKSCDLADGWLPLGFSCYKKMVTPNGWLGARHDCIWEGGDLVSIASPDEEAFVKEQMGDHDPFWIGLSNLKCDEAWCRYDKEQKKLTWSDVRVMASYSNWDSRQVGSADEESCAYVNQGVHRDNQPGKWRHGSCGSSLAFMCERPLNDCPEGWPCAFKDFRYNRVETSYCDPFDFLFDDSCYHFEGMKKVQWAAERFCRERQGHLTSVLSVDEGNFLAAHMREGFQPFVGLRKKENKWFDGKPTYNDTQLMGKKSKVSDECFALSASGQVDEWSCTKEQPSICKKAKVREALPDLPSTRGPGGSEKCGWWMDNPSNDFCYLPNYKSRKTWQEARDDCLGLGGDLLSITNSYEQNFIQGLYALPLTSPSLWLGSHANITDGIEWIDGSMSTYKNLKTGIAGEGPGGSCLSLLTVNGRWEFADCKKESSYICKRRGKANPESACEKGWSPHRSSCYKKMATPNGWVGARYDCVWEGGDLVSIASSDEEAFVKKQMDENPFWIGLSNLNCEEAWCRHDDKARNKLTWSDARVTVTYSNWDSRHVLNVSSDKESCAYVNQGALIESQPGKWRHGSCGSSLAFMCERPLNDCPKGQSCSFKDFGYDRVETSSCDPGDFLFDDSCYHFEWRRKDWQFAEEFCMSQNGHLASIDSEDELKFLAAHVQDNRRYWPFMGLKRNKDKTFSWSKAPAKNFTLKGGKSLGRGDCVALSALGEFHEWPCTKKQPFVCEKAKVREDLSNLPSWGPDWTEKCGSWVENPYDNFCYLINSKSRKTWQEAQDDCLRLGGDLLSITNYAEQIFIQGLSGGYRNITSWWLATKSDITQEGIKWADGSPVRYTHWTTESPSNPSGENCLYLPTKRKLGKWKFDNCQKRSSYMCKKRARGQKPEPPHHDGFREILVCDQKKHVELFCQSDGQSVIRIQSAFYGRRNGSVCPTGSGKNETCVVQGALPHYRRKCDNRQYCLADPFEGVDNCPAVSKYLHMVYSCERKVCLDSLVKADKRIDDSAFEASSSMTDASPEKARWSSYSCWRPAQDASTSWIQVNLGHVRKVTGIVTQGCPHANQRSCVVFAMKTSVDGKSWTEHPDEKFTRGGDHQFGSPLSAQYVRILPLESSVDFGLSFDLLGCARDDAMTCDSTFNSLHLTKAMTFHCPPKCADSQHNVTGTLVYNEDSSVCMAAIHAGVIRNDIGGDCIVMKAVAKNGFAGSTQNGITSLKSADSTDKAFTFADREPRCLDESWEEFAGFCYKAFEDKKNWADAQTVCMKLGANLVSILSEVEEKWVKKASDLDTSDMWTGLNDLSVLGMFEWSDHHEVTFTNWAPEEPKNSEKDCVAMSQMTGKWKQMSCELPNSFMCKMPKAHYAFTSVKAEESHSGDSILWHRNNLTKSANVVAGSTVELKGGLRVNDVITITGRANKLADWFKINLFVPDNETDNMVALFLKLNFVTKKIWLYSKVSTTWDKREEHPTQSSGPGQEVKVAIKCAEDHFLITINDLDEVTYKYREANLQSITQMIVWGHVSIKDIKQSSA
ncbi:secretory phospholipase A2 receptor-like isoform 2-T2 [Syngnathus typhle]